MNELVNLRARLYKNKGNHKELLCNMLNKFKYLYSYIVYDKKEYWQVDILYSKTKQYNTIPVDKLISEVIKAESIKDKSLQLSDNICTYCQPPLEILLVTYKPLIYKLAVQQHQYWPQVELEDLLQMCNMRICVLYQQGYYIHKNLLTRSFVNDVLMFLRPEKRKPRVDSLDQMLISNDGENNISLVETIEDEHAQDELNEIIDEADGITVEQEIKNKMLEVIKEFITPRMYDQLLREYGNKTTSNNTRVMVNRLKSQLKDLGITVRTITDQVVKRS